MCFNAHKVSSWHVNLYISSSFNSPLLHCHYSSLMSKIFSVSTPSLFHLFRYLPIPSEPIFFLLRWRCSSVSIQHKQWTPPSTIQVTCAETVIYSDNSPWHKPLHIPNMASSKSSSLYLVIYTKNAIDRILNLWFWVLHWKKSMIIVYMVYIKFGNNYIIRQTTKLKWPPNILVILYAINLSMAWTITHK